MTARSSDTQNETRNDDRRKRLSPVLQSGRQELNPRPPNFIQSGSPVPLLDFTDECLQSSHWYTHRLNQPPTNS